jgi:hypothetical protein
MISDSFEISDGCKLKPGSFIQRCAPFTLLKPNTAISPRVQMINKP